MTNGAIVERTEALSLLELGNGATRDEIKARAIRLFNEYHPDKHAEATGNATLKKLLEEKFNKVREARDCLLNGGVFDAGAFTPNAAKPPPPADEVPKACKAIGISHADFAAALSRLDGLFSQPEPAESVTEGVFPGLVNVLKRSEVFGPIIIRTKLELLKTLESNPALQNLALKILEGEDVAEALIALPFAGIAVAYSMLGNPKKARIPKQAEVLASTWADGLGKEDALEALGESILRAMRAPLSGIAFVMQQRAATLGVVLHDEPWNTLVGAVLRRLASLSFWTALKLLPKGEAAASTAPPQEDRIAKVLCENIKAAVDSGDWANVAWRAVELAKRPGHEQAARRFLARACIQLGRFDTAKEAALAATKFDSNDDEAWFLLALTLAKQEQWQEAGDAIRKAIWHSNTTEPQYEKLLNEIQCARSPETAAGSVGREEWEEEWRRANTFADSGDEAGSETASSLGLETEEGRVALAAFFGIIGAIACAVFWGWVGFFVGGIVSVLVAAGVISFLASSGRTDSTSSTTAISDSQGATTEPVATRVRSDQIGIATAIGDTLRAGFCGWFGLLAIFGGIIGMFTVIGLFPGLILIRGGIWTMLPPDTADNETQSRWGVYTIIGMVVWLVCVVLLVRVIVAA